MPLTPPPLEPHLLALIKLAVREDLGTAGDLTALHAIPADDRSAATIVARKPGIIAGTFLLPHILKQYAADLPCAIVTPDGTRVSPGTPVATITGSTRAILSAERVLLNFLGHASGIATATRRYVDAVASVPRPPAICDTRKTTPAFRALDKYAVAAGGGVNHRMGLYDGVMLKDNHLAALRARFGEALTLAQLTTRLRAELPPDVTLWLEVDTLDQLRDALPEKQESGADIILLDNFTPDQMRQAVALRNAANPARPLLEASGGITLETIADVARTGVERISIGALTHSAPVLDLSLEL